MKWTVYLSGAAERDIKRLDRAAADRVKHALKRLADIGAGDIQKLKSIGNEYRLRVGDIRVLYRLHRADKEIEVFHILPRDKAYRVREADLEYGEPAMVEATA